MEMKKSYKLIRGFLKTFSRRMTIIWDEPYNGEASVFCPNHAGIWGPVDMCVHFTLRDECHPWFNADIAHKETAPDYVRQDYWWKPGCRLEKFYNAVIPNLAAAVIPPILATVPGVPVYHDMQVLKTFRQSASILKSGESLIIFAEEPAGYKSSCSYLHSGFLQIAPMMWRSNGMKLQFYPVHLDHKKKTIHVYTPVRYDPERSLKEQEQEIMDYLTPKVLGK